MGSSAPQYPIALKAVPGSHSLDHVRNAVASLGDAAGPWPQPGDWVPVDVLFPQTLILLAGQGSPAVASGRDSKPSAVAGGVWVREQITVHGPMRIGEAFEVSGEIVRSYSRKGRLYSVSCSTTRNAAGERLVTNRTTGLVRYRPDPAIADAEQGLAETELGEIAADWDAAAGNPCASALRSARVGDAYSGETHAVTLEMMRERDGGRSANPIHTEPEEARRAGLAAPIAGGPHVFGFVQRLLTRAFGPEVLLHGGTLDVRWRAPVHAGQRVKAYCEVRNSTSDRVEFDFRVERGDVVAMTGCALVPLQSRS